MLLSFIPLSPTLGIGHAGLADSCAAAVACHMLGFLEIIQAVHAERKTLVSKECPL